MSQSSFPQGTIAGAAAGWALTLANVPATVTDLGAATTTYRATLEFESDGELWTRRNTGADVDHGGWVDPEDGSGNGQATKYVYQSGDNSHNVGTLTNNTYRENSTTSSHGMQYTSGGGSDDISQVVDFYLAEDTGGTGEIGPASVTINVGELF